MHVIEIFLPLTDNDGNNLPRQLFKTVEHELVVKFSGLTAFTRNPAKGLWAPDGDVQKDEVVTFEVMSEALDRAWWREYKTSLERRFDQDEVIIRTYVADLL